MCTVLLPPGVNPIAVNKYIVPFHIYRTISNKMAAVQMFFKISVSDDNERLDLASEIWYGCEL
jgi:hypothetical protein